MSERNLRERESFSDYISNENEHHLPRLLTCNYPSSTGDIWTKLENK